MYFQSCQCNGKLARRHLRLIKFDLKLSHSSGVKHQAADKLSRLQTNGTDNSDIDDGIPVLSIQKQFCKEKPQLLDVSQYYDDPTILIHR